MQRYNSFQYIVRKNFLINIILHTLVCRNNIFISFTAIYIQISLNAFFGGFHKLIRIKHYF
jgi:hypothetical protein